MIDELFNFVYSLLETEMHNSMLGYESQSNVKVDLRNIVTLRADDGTVFSFMMRNGKIRSMWMDGEKCPFDSNMKRKLTNLMKS